LELLEEHGDYLAFQVFASQNLMTISVDSLPLFVQDVIKVQQVLPNIKVVAFHFDLGVANGLCDQLVLNGNIFINPGPTHYRLDAITAEPAHQLVIQRDVKLGAAGVTLASCSAAKLIIDTPGLVALGAEDVESSQGNNPVVLILPLLD
jgi:hypothetical protein